MNYALFFDFTFDADFGLFLPNAYLTQRKGNAHYFFKKATDEILKNLTDFALTTAESEALTLVNSLQKSVLIKKFVKKDTTLSIIYKNTQQKHIIQSFIEEKTDDLLTIITENGLSTTINYRSNDEISKQYLTITSKTLEPLLNFEKVETGIRYCLFLQDGDIQKVPSQHHIKLLNNEKSWVVIDGELLRITHIKALNIKPFLDKDEVFIPNKLIGEYFNKFLKGILKKVEITAKGFEIQQKQQILTTKMRLVNDFFVNCYKIYLEFDYDGYHFVSNQRKTSHSVLEITESDSIIIKNYKRDIASEREKCQFLIQLGFTEEDGMFFREGSYPFTTYFYIIQHRDILLTNGFLLNHLEINKKTVEVLSTELIFDKTQTENDWFDLQIKVKHGETEFFFKDLIQNIKENNPIFVLPNEKIFVIPQEWFSRYGRLTKFTKIRNGKWQLPKNNYVLLDELPELQNKALITNVEYIPSANLKATLRPYQIEGVKWLLEHHYNGLGACLADDMGLGKTLQTIALLVDIHDRLPEKEIENPTNLFDIGQKQKEPLKTLVILPSSLVFNWYDETKRFAPQLKCLQYVGNDRKNKANRLLNYDMIFTSYPIVTRDAKIFQKYEFRYIILDESQRIKNKNSQTFKAIHAIKAQHKISLSGTPIENSLSDLWSQMQFINPNVLGSFSHFSTYFKHGIEKKQDPTVLEELKTIISPFLLRRTKEQVLDDLPEMTEQIVYCELSEAQKKWYEQEKSKARNELLRINAQHMQLNALNVLIRLRQISNHPKLVDKNSEIPSGKYEEIVNHMEIIRDSSQKALIFSSFTSHLAIFERWCQENKIQYAKLTGEIPSNERKKQVELFQNDKNVIFFFISLKAGEVGLNLTEASHVLLLDPWWNPFSEKQAIARAHRLGQKNKVNVIRFVSKNTVEEKIIRLQQTKKELSQNIVEESRLVTEIIEHIDDFLS